MEEDRKIWWHWQNLSQKGQFPFEGRGWLNTQQSSLSIEWHLGRIDFGIHFSISEDSERTVDWSVKLPGLSLFFCVDSVRLARAISARWGRERYPYFERDFSFYWHDYALWFRLWGPDDYCDREAPWWQQMHSLHFDDLFLGKTKFTTREAGQHRITIHMPEHSYDAWAVEKFHVWKRPRWFARRSRTIWIEFRNEDEQSPPRFAGKGENSWDQDDNGIWGVGFDVPEHWSLTTALDHAAQSYVERVKENRARYGAPSEVK